MEQSSSGTEKTRHGELSDDCSTGAVSLTKKQVRFTNNLSFFDAFFRIHM